MLSSAHAMKPSLDGDDQTNTKELEKLGIENKEVRNLPGAGQNGLFIRL